eukprot:3101699-Amphidinium_carterae.1
MVWGLQQVTHFAAIDIPPLEGGCDDRNVILLTIFFHDLVYDPKRSWVRNQVGIHTTAPSVIVQCSQSLQSLFGTNSYRCGLRSFALTVATERITIATPQEYPCLGEFVPAILHRFGGL